jgi:hypothetical protein
MANRRKNPVTIGDADLVGLSWYIWNRLKKERRPNAAIILDAINRFLIIHAKSSRYSNPVPASRTVQLREAATLYEDFSGHNAEVVAELDKPAIPDVLIAVGDCDGILYTTVRDHKTERYIHEFKAKSRPLFAVSFDGKQIHLLGGAYDFTERGIVDKT